MIVNTVITGLCCYDVKIAEAFAKSIKKQVPGNLYLDHKRAGNYNNSKYTQWLIAFLIILFGTNKKTS